MAQFDNGVQTEEDFATLQAKVQSRSDEYNTNTAPQGTSQVFESIPSYLLSSATHAIGYGDISGMSTDMSPTGGTIGMTAGAVAGAYYGSALGPMGTIAGAVIGGAIGYDWRYAVDAFISGTSQLVNGGIHLVNFLPVPGEISEIDTDAVIASLDDDLSQYYQANKDSIDTAGFVASSIIPGMAGIKGLNWGSKVLDKAITGVGGRGLTGATGLLPSMRATYLARAEQALVQNGGTYNFMEQNVLKAVATSAATQALEFSAFEVGVQAMMAPSPILQAQDSKDIASNIWDAAKVGAFFGAAGSAIGTSYNLLKRVGAIDLAKRSAEFQKGVVAGTKFDSAYANNASSIDDIATKGVGFDKEQIRTISSLDDKNRQLIHDMLPSVDKDIGNMFHQLASTKGTKASDIVMGVTDMSNVTHITEKELQLDAIKRKVDMGKELVMEEKDMLLHTSVKYVPLWGEDAGRLTTDIKDAQGNTYQVWDLITKGNKIHIDATSASTAASGGITYKPQIDKPFSMLEHLNTTKDVATANLRELWAMHTDTKLQAYSTISIYDPALLRKAEKEVAETNPFNISMPDGSVTLVHTAEDIQPLLLQGIREVAEKKLIEAMQLPANTAGRLHEEAVASALGVKTNALRNTAVTDSQNIFADTHALESYRQEYANDIVGKTKVTKATVTDNILLLPRRAKLVFDTSRVTEEDINSIPFQARFKSEQRLLQQDADIAVLRALPEDIAASLPAGEDAATVSTTHASGAAGILSPASYELGSGGAFWQRVGALVSRAKVMAANNVIGTINVPLSKLADSPLAAARLGAIINDAQSTSEAYYHVPGRGLVRRELLAYEEALASGANVPYPAKLDPNAKDVIEIPTQFAAILDPIIGSHTAVNGQRVSKISSLRNTMGVPYNADPRAVYFPPPNLAHYPHVALVKDPTLTGVLHGSSSRMLYAASEQELNKLIASIPEEFQAGIIKKPVATTKSEMEAWFKATKDYKEQEAMTENYFNAAFQRSGVAARYFPQTDAKVITKDIIDWHIAQEHKVVREAVSLKYFKEFHELRALGERGTNAETSVLAPRGSAADQTHRAMDKVNNPYMSLIRTALDLSIDEHLPLHTFQDALDRKVSAVWDGITSMLATSKSVADLDAIVAEAKAAGIHTLTPEAYHLSLVNHSLPQGALNTFTRRTSGLLSAIILKPSMLNAMLNYVGTAVMLAPEVDHIMQLMKSGTQPELIGALKDSHVSIPGTQHSYFSVAKLMAQNIKRAGDPAWIQWGEKKGFDVRTSLEFSRIEDLAALTGSETTFDLNNKLERMYSIAMKGGDWLEKKTFNSLAESKTRLTTALIMEDLTRPLVAAGKMSPQLAEVYIQNLVNRVNGVYQTSQRPLMFRGPIGQAMGLFQTYSITMYNNILRHAAQGNTRSVALMGLLQGGIHGMASVPGFQQLNTNLVGSLAGNTDHTDVYSLMYQATDKNTADWMLYGALSNVGGLLSPDLKMNMYTRGDANPRHVSIVPLSPMDWPIVSTSAKFFGNLADAFDQSTQSNVPISATLMSALEHNGISRELTGLAAVLQGFANPNGRSFSTSAHGNLNAANDLHSLMNISRLLGAKPLDQAIQADQIYRTGVYHARNVDLITSLGAGIKNKLRTGEEVTFEDVRSFQAEYARRGGDIENFSKYWMKLNKDATVTQANQLMQHLKRPDAQAMLALMGGRRPEMDY